MTTTRTKKIRSCQRKKRYLTYLAAQARSNGLWKQEIYTRVYPCTICKGFHLSHVSRSARLELAFEQICGK